MTEHTVSGRPNSAIATSAVVDDAAATTRTQGARARRAASPRADLLVVLGASVTAIVAWALWTQAVGVDLAVRSGDQTQQVGFAMVLVTAAVVSLAGVALARVLQRSSDRGLRWWTIIAAATWAVSLLGPLGALTATAGVALASLHLLVGAIVLFGVRAPRRAR